MLEVKKSYRSILQTAPDYPDANHNLGILMTQRGKVELSLAYLRAAFEDNPKKGRILVVICRKPDG